MGTERLLFVIEDLFKFQNSLSIRNNYNVSNFSVIDHIKDVIQANDIIREKIDALFRKILERGSKITEKCIDLISEKLLQRICESMSLGLNQIPQKLRIQSSLPSNLPSHSDFLALVYKPVTQLNMNKYFVNMNPSSKLKLISYIIQ